MLDLFKYYGLCHNKVWLSSSAHPTPSNWRSSLVILPQNKLRMKLSNHLLAMKYGELCPRWGRSAARKAVKLEQRISQQENAPRSPARLLRLDGKRTRNNYGATSLRKSMG